MSIDRNLKFPDGNNVDYFNGELPNGSARVVTRSAQERETSSDLMGGQDAALEEEYEEQRPIPAFDVEHELRPDPLFADEKFADEKFADEPDTALEVEEAVVDDASRIDAVAEKPVQQPEAPTQDSFQEVEEVIVINVFAKDEAGFNGADLLRVILACGMRYGDMNIFHRSEDDKGGAIQFSMANIVKPGTFDLDTMASFYTPGVSFFLSLPGPKDSMKAFEYMLETAQCLVKNLQGELKDEMHSVMTAQTIEHSRQKVRDYERRQLSLLR